MREFSLQACSIFCPQHVYFVYVILCIYFNLCNWGLSITGVQMDYWVSIYKALVYLSSPVNQSFQLWVKCELQIQGI